MLFKSYGVVALATLAMANPQVTKRDSMDASELLSLASAVGITSLPTNTAALASIESAVASLTAILPPASILSVLETAVPASVISDLSNPTSASVFASEFAAGSTPAWYSSLPANVKSFFNTFSPTLAAAAATSTGTTLTGTNSGSSATASSSSGTAVTQASAGGAARPTGVMAACLGGVVGVLGLAIAL